MNKESLDISKLASIFISALVLLMVCTMYAYFNTDNVTIQGTPSIQMVKGDDGKIAYMILEMNNESYKVHLQGADSVFLDFTVHSVIVLEMHTSHYLFPVGNLDDGFWVIDGMYKIPSEGD
jgi:hypothetical protein